MTVFQYNITGNQSPPLPKKSRDIQFSKSPPIVYYEGDDWVTYFTRFLKDERIDARPSKSGTKDTYIQVYGEKQPTDCRTKGLKRIGFYKHGGVNYLTTWGITKGEIHKHNLESWVRHVTRVCDRDPRWMDHTSTLRPIDWKKKGINGGFTGRFMLVTDMKIKDVCDVVRVLINQD